MEANAESIVPHPRALEETLRPLKSENLRRLRKLLDGKLEFEHYEDFSISPIHFDWSPSGPIERNWWWQIQQLPTLAWAIGDWSEDMHQFRHVRKLNARFIEGWALKNHLGNGTSPLAWHDHAGAIRAYNLFRWVNCMHAHGSPFGPDVQRCVELVLYHVKWLLKPTNYTKHTNHGFEQSWMLLAIIVGWRSAFDENAERVALGRVRNEVQFAFTAQGVHKENSPGYHVFMLKRLKELDAFLVAYDMDLDGIDLNGLVHRGERFLDAIALPSNDLPLIGDTQRKANQHRYVDALRSKGQTTVVQESIADYSASGYIIWRRSATEGVAGSHFVMKSAHLSDYHRHDDDLSIHLCFNGTTVLGDCGLFSHNMTHLARRYARSPYAHNTVFPMGCEQGIRKLARLRKPPTLEWDSERRVARGTTFQFKRLRLSRRVKLGSRTDRLLNIVDHAVNGEEIDRLLITNFVLPARRSDLLICREGSKLKVRSQRYEVTFDHGDSRIRDIRIVYGMADSVPNTAIISETMGSTMDATRIEYLWSVDGASQQRVKISLSLGAIYD